MRMHLPNTLLASKPQSPESIKEGHHDPQEYSSVFNVGTRRYGSGGISMRQVTTADSKTAFTHM